MNKTVISMAAISMIAFGVHAKAATCTNTGFMSRTALLINPPVVTGTVDATGCNVAVYYDAGHSGVVKNAEIFGANYFGVLVNGDAGSVSVDVLNSNIHDIGESPHNGQQHGIGVSYRGFFDVSAVSGRIVGNTVAAYQKNGIALVGSGVQAIVSDNVVTGDGHVTHIAQNGIEVGFGATASVMRNTVSGNSYIGTDGSSAGGILVVGGAAYGTCPDGNDCPYTVNTRITDNVVLNSDVGIFLSNIDANDNPPAQATNIKAVNNTISDDQCFNLVYQAGVSDQGNNDKIINNQISGPGYQSCGVGHTVDVSATNRPKVEATK